jgi:hypothetical protein
VEGKGRTLNENDNLRDMLTKDKGVLSAINRDIPILQTKGTYKGHIKLEQGDYADQDFRYAFGAIDRLDFEVDFDKKTLHAWFQDRYEWHPVYPGLYKKYPGDVERETNCVHAALVEMKLSGAADYWMKGEAKVPLKLTTSAPTTDRSGDYDSVS